jgi:DNA-binding MarR family transcriptional regulator
MKTSVSPLARAGRQRRTDALGQLMVAVFRVNGLLLAAGNHLVAPIGLTSARWQVLGAIALAGRPLAAPDVGAAMGISRQGAQKQLNALLADDLVETWANPQHERSPLYALTAAGRRAFERAMERHEGWVATLAAGLKRTEIDAALSTLLLLAERIEASKAL